MVIKLSHKEAEALGHDRIGTAHLLLGILKEEDNSAARILNVYGVSLDNARAALEESVGRGVELNPSSHMPFTDDAKKVLEIALSEANSLHLSYIGPEHLLLGIERQAEGEAVVILDMLDVSLVDLRRSIYGDILGRPDTRTAEAQRPREDIERDISRAEASLELLHKELEALD